MKEKTVEVRSFLGLNEGEDRAPGEAASLRNLAPGGDGSLELRPGTEELASVAVRSELYHTGRLREITGGTLELWPGLVLDEDDNLMLTGQSVTADRTDGADYVGWYRLEGGEPAVLASFTPGSQTAVFTLELLGIKRKRQSQPVTLRRCLIGGEEGLYAACDWALYGLFRRNGLLVREKLTPLGSERPCLLSLRGALGILDGTSFQIWDGTALRTPEPYIPTVRVACGPLDGGRAYEERNLLTGYRKVRFNTDGESTQYLLPEKAQRIVSVTYGGETVTWAWRQDSSALVFQTPPQAGIGALEATYYIPDQEPQVPNAMRGGTLLGVGPNARLALWGDGSTVLFCGTGRDGVPRWDYYPPSCRFTVGEGDGPILAACGYGSALWAFRQGEAWRLDITSNGQGGLNVRSRLLGPCSPVENGAVLGLEGPVLLEKGEVTSWGGGRSPISRKCRSTLESLDLAQPALMALGEELCISDGAGTVLVYDEAAKRWYPWQGPRCCSFEQWEGDLVYGSGDGAVCRFDRELDTDSGQRISAYLRTGSLVPAGGRRWSASGLTVLTGEEGIRDLRAVVTTDRGSIIRDLESDRAVTRVSARFQGCAEFGLTLRLGTGSGGRIRGFVINAREGGRVL